VLALVAPVAVMALVAERDSGMIDGTRSTLLVLAYVVYLMVFVIVGLTASARARRGQHALLALLVIWLFGAFVIPRGAYAIANRLYPSPTPQDFAAALEQIDRAGNVGFLQQRAAIERRLLAEYGVSKPTELPVSTWGMTLYEREVESSMRYNVEFARLFDTYARQQRIVDVIATFAPPVAIRRVSMALAATDVAHYRHFSEAAEAYRYKLVQTMNTVAVESRLYNSSPTLADAPDQAAFPEGESTAYERVGPFTYRPPTGVQALSTVMIPASAMMVWMIGVLGLLALSVQHVRVDP
jgi:ABC-2 type transport system permease protein